MGLITKKREDTSLTTIAFSVLVTNIFGSFKLAVEESETVNNCLKLSGSRALEPDFQKIGSC